MRDGDDDPKYPMWTIGDVVHNLRIAQQWSYSELRERTGVKSIATLSDLENAVRRPQRETVACVAGAFGHTRTSLANLVPVTRTVSKSMRQLMRDLDALSPVDREELLAMFRSLTAVKLKSDQARQRPQLGIKAMLE